MKIKQKKVERISFGVLKAGEVFEHNNNVTYMKTRLDALAGVAAVNLQTGELRYFEDGSLVRHLPDAFLTPE